MTMSTAPQKDLPAFQDLPAYCRSQIAQGGFSIPWPDYLQPRDRSFRQLYPANGGPEFYNPNAIRLLQVADQLLYENPKVTALVRMNLRFEILGYKSWLHQLQTGETPECVGNGYRAWLAYLRGAQRRCP